MDLHFYLYEGPVKSFDTIVANYWRGTTHAVSEPKARSNLTYQFKQKYGFAAKAKITLPGKITLVK